MQCNMYGEEKSSLQLLIRLTKELISETLPHSAFSTTKYDTSKLVLVQTS